MGGDDNEVAEVVGNPGVIKAIIVRAHKKSFGCIDKRRLAQSLAWWPGKTMVARRSIRYVYMTERLET